MRGACRPPLKDADDKPVTETVTVKEQVLPMGPAASQVAIKQLGTNGGGFFNVNSAHPFENPTPLTNFLEMLAILLIPAALCYTFGVMVGDTRQGWAVLAARYWLMIPTLAIAGSLVRKKPVPAGPGTLPTHTSLFVVILIGVVIIVGALTFIPALALGPIVEHLLMVGA